MKIPYQFRGLIQLVVLFVVLPVAMWYFALHNTVITWAKNQRMNRTLKAENFQTGSAHQDTKVFSENQELILSGRLLDSIRSFATPEIRVTEYSPMVSVQDTGVSIHSTQLTLTGTFPGLLAMVDQFEKHLVTCRLQSMEWRMTISPQSRQPQLALTLYIQQPVINSYKQ